MNLKEFIHSEIRNTLLESVNEDRVNDFFYIELKKKMWNRRKDYSNKISKLNGLEKTEYLEDLYIKLNGPFARDIKGHGMDLYKRLVNDKVIKEDTELDQAFLKAEPVEEETKRDYKKEYEKYGKSKKAKKYRAELNKYNRQKGTYGNGDGKDASHKGGKIVGFEDESKNRGRREKSRLKKEATFVPVSGTKAGGTLHLDRRKYQLKKDVKDVQIGNYIVTLPKGTILYNLAGGVLADHKSLEQYETRSQKYFKKSNYRGIMIRQKEQTIRDIEKNSKVLESVNEGMVEPRRGHNYYQLIKAAPVKYIESQSNPFGATGVLLHNKDGYIKGVKGAYIIDYFGAHFYVDLKSKFATPIYGLKDQRELRKAIQSVGMAPEHSDWKKYVKEIPLKNESTINEGPVDRVVGGRPYEYIGDGRKGKAIVSGPMKDKERTEIIKRAKKAGYSAAPGIKGGVVIHIESVNEADITIGGKEYNLKKSGSKITLINKKLSADKFVFRNTKEFKDWADDQVEPIGGTQSSHFGINEEQLDEKLITFSNRAPYGQIVFMAGGAGSGKGFAIDNFIDAAGFKVRDVDEMKKAVGKLDQLGKFSVDKWYKKYGKKLSDKPAKGGGLSPKAHVEEFVLGKGLSISDISKDLKNPNNVASLHYIVDSMGLKDKWLISMLSGKNNKETLPNLLFDITAKKVSSITDVIKPLIANGYDSKNIHLIWVLTNFHVAIQANKERDRMVPEDILLQTHEGAGKSMWSVMTKILPKGLNGRIDVILNNRNKTIPYKDKDGKPIKVEPNQQNKLDKAKIVVKDFRSLPIKKQGGGILPEKTWKMKLKSWILDNAPKTIDLSQDLETSEEYMI